MWEVTHLVGVAPLSASRWRQALEREGMEGLCARRHPGKPLKPTSHRSRRWRAYGELGRGLPVRPWICEL